MAGDISSGNYAGGLVGSACLFVAQKAKQGIILPLAIEVCTMPLQKIPPSDNIIFFAEIDGGLELGGATFGFFRSFDLRLKSGL